MRPEQTTQTHRHSHQMGFSALTAIAQSMWCNDSRWCPLRSIISITNRSHSGTTIMSAISIQIISMSQVQLSQRCGGGPVVRMPQPPNCTLLSRPHVVPLHTVCSPIVFCSTPLPMMSAVYIGWIAICLSYVKRERERQRHSEWVETKTHCNKVHCPLNGPRRGHQVEGGCT